MRGGIGGTRGHATAAQRQVDERARRRLDRVSTAWALSIEAETRRLDSLLREAGVHSLYLVRRAEPRSVSSIPAPYARRGIDLLVRPGLERLAGQVLSDDGWARGKVPTWACKFLGSTRYEKESLDLDLHWKVRDARPAMRRLRELALGQRQQVMPSRLQQALAMRREGFGFVASSRKSVRMQFQDLELSVMPGVFEPRPSIAAEMVASCVALTDEMPRPLLVEVGTGCGVIGLTYSRLRPDARVVALDISHRAVRCAKRNRDANGLRSVSVARSDLLEALPDRAFGAVDVVVANMPYVPPAAAMGARWGEQLNTAQGSGEDGLGLVLEVARQATTSLRGGGLLVLQALGWQWEILAEELADLGYDRVDAQIRHEDRAAVGSAVWLENAG